MGGDQGLGGRAVEDKATSTDDELLIVSSPPGRRPGGSGRDEEGGMAGGGGGAGRAFLDLPYRNMARAAQIWGADLIGAERPPDRPHSAPRSSRLRHQESLSSNSDVSRPRRQSKLRRQHTTESCDSDSRSVRRAKARELRRQWTTDSSDSGYSKRHSRELRRQDTEESAGSTRKLIRELQRQPTTESSSSIRLTRQSSIRSGSDNQSLHLLRQSTIETYDDASTTDFSRPQSCNSGRNTTSPSAPHAPEATTPGHLSVTTPLYDETHFGSASSGGGGGGGGRGRGGGGGGVRGGTGDGSGGGGGGGGGDGGGGDGGGGCDNLNFKSSSAVPSTLGAPLFHTTSCSLIDLSAVNLETSQLKEIQRDLKIVVPVASAVAAPSGAPVPAESKRRRESEALRQARDRVRRRRNKDELPKKVRWSIIATGLVLLLMSVILVGATLKMAPLIDEMVRKENEDIFRDLQAAYDRNNTDSGGATSEDVSEDVLATTSAGPFPSSSSYIHSDNIDNSGVRSDDVENSGTEG